MGKIQLKGEIRCEPLGAQRQLPDIVCRPSPGLSWPVIAASSSASTSSPLVKLSDCSSRVRRRQEAFQPILHDKGYYPEGSYPESSGAGAHSCIVVWQSNCQSRSAEVTCGNPVKGQSWENDCLCRGEGGSEFNSMEESRQLLIF